MLTNDQKRILLYNDPAISESLKIATLCLANMMHPLTRPDEYPALAVKAKRAADALLGLYLLEEQVVEQLSRAADDGVNYEGGS